MHFEVMIAEIARSWRALLRKPGYLVVSGITLALGVAACVGVFALVKASLLAPVPVPNADRVVVVGPPIDGRNAGGLAPIQLGQLDGLEGTSGIGAASPMTSLLNLQNGDQPIIETAWKVSSGFLQVLGMPMRLGRGFSAAESRPNGPGAVILSYGYWKSSFGMSPSVLGRTLKIDGQSTPIIGVLPADFPYHTANLLLPLALTPNDTSWAGGYRVITRLAPGASLAQVRDAAGARLSRLDQQYHMSRFENHKSYIAQPIADSLHAGMGSQQVLGLFGAAAGVLLLIVLVNMTSLSLQRIFARAHEHALRSALGAPLSRLVLPGVGEQILVGLVGGCSGLTLAAILLRVTRTAIPPEWFISAETQPTVGIAGILLAFCLGLFIVAIALVIGTWKTRSTPLQRVLVGGERIANSRGNGRTGRVMVVLQTSLATVLLLLAALCAHTLWSALHTDYGFDAQRVLTFSFKPDRHNFPGQTEMLAKTDSIVSRIESIPGVTRAAYGTNVPATGTEFNDTAPFVTSNQRTVDSVVSYLVSPGFLETLSIPVERGQGFDRNRSGNSDSIIISDAVRKMAPTSTSLGQSLELPYHAVNPAWTNLPLRIRGVTHDIRAFGAGYGAPAVAWIPFMSNSEHLFETWRDSDSLWFIVKVNGDPTRYTQSVLKAVREVAPDLSITQVRPLAEFQTAGLSQQRLNLALIAVFAVAALVLASVGMYSVMARSVTLRQQEFGIRIALGASPARLLRSVLIAGWWQVATGLALGLVIALAASRLIQHLLYGASAADPQAIVMVLFVLTGAGVLACLAPALRAARMQPMEALKTK